jgi:transcriptional regulator with XRE-family HTH domain
MATGLNHVIVLLQLESNHLILLTRLKYWRELRGYSVRELAGLSGVNYTTISLIENRKRGAQPKTVHDLAVALAVEVSLSHTPPAPITAPLESANNYANSTIPLARTRARKVKLTGLWVGVEAGHVYLARDQEAADYLKGQFGRVRVYRADSWKEADELHRSFIAREKLGRDAW